jgi:hypothetical protein
VGGSHLGRGGSENRPTCGTIGPFSSWTMLLMRGVKTSLSISIAPTAKMASS